MGCVLFSLGASSFILSNLGTDPLDVFAIGIKQTFGLMIGTTQSLFALLCLITWSIINRFKSIVEDAVRSRDLSLSERKELTQSFKESISGYTYFEN